jgi:AcrR family transcriptional regulator
VTQEPSLRERKKQRTRLELAAAATALFRERGFDATTIDDIAGRAGCSRRTFFRYFASKEDVAFGDALERLATFRQRLEEAGPPDGAAGVVAVLRAALRDQAMAFYAEPVDRASMDLWFSTPALRRRFLEISEAWEEAAGAFLARHLDAASVVGPQVLATALCGVVKATLRARLAGPGDAAAALDDGFALIAAADTQGHLALGAFLA